MTAGVETGFASQLISTPLFPIQTMKVVHTPPGSTPRAAVWVILCSKESRAVR